MLPFTFKELGVVTSVAPGRRVILLQFEATRMVGGVAVLGITTLEPTPGTMLSHQLDPTAQSLLVIPDQPPGVVTRMDTFDGGA
jgi:hypothetical protein